MSAQLERDGQAAHRLLAKAKAEAHRARQAQLTPPPPPAPEPPPPPEDRGPPPTLDERVRRAKPRVKMHAHVDLHSDDNFFTGFSANSSDGGLFIATVNMVPIGTETDVSFTLPSGERIQAHGVVCWHREVNDTLVDAFPGIGVQFTRLEEVALGAIKQFVQGREPLFYAAA